MAAAKVENSLNIEQTPQEVVAKLTGRVDLHFVDKHRAEFLKLFPTDQTVVLDFQAVDFLDSSALGLLATLKREASKTGATIILRSVSNRIKKVLDITRLSEAFTFQ